MLTLSLKLLDLDLMEHDLFMKELRESIPSLELKLRTEVDLNPSIGKLEGK